MNDSISILAAFVILVFIFRWLFGKIQNVLTTCLSSHFPVGGPSNSNDSTPQRRLPNDRRRAVTPEMVQTVQQMFPHIPPAAIHYDLQRTGSVQVTCDKILSEGDLPIPPPNFPIPLQYQPQPSPADRGSGSSSSSSASASRPSLVNRFNLSSKLSSEVAEPPKVWEATAEKRQRLLQMRKEAMILAARKKMMSSKIGNVSEPVGLSPSTPAIAGRAEPQIKTAQEIIDSDPDLFTTKENMKEPILEEDVEEVATMLETNTIKKLVSSRKPSEVKASQDIVTSASKPTRPPLVGPIPTNSSNSIVTLAMALESTGEAVMSKEKAHLPVAAHAPKHPEAVSAALRAARVDANSMGETQQRDMGKSSITAMGHP